LDSIASQPPPLIPPQPYNCVAAAPISNQNRWKSCVPSTGGSTTGNAAQTGQSQTSASNPETNSQTTGSLPDASGSQSSTTGEPVVSGLPSSTTGLSTGLIEFVVTVTAVLPVPPTSFDAQKFGQEVAMVLEINIKAIAEIQLNLQLSNSTSSYITFEITNYGGINPVLIAQRLQQLCDSKDPLLSQNGLGGLTVTYNSLTSTETAVANASKNYFTITMTALLILLQCLSCI